MTVQSHDDDEEKRSSIFIAGVTERVINTGIKKNLIDSIEYFHFICFTFGRDYFSGLKNRFNAIMSSYKFLPPLGT